MTPDSENKKRGEQNGKSSMIMKIRADQAGPTSQVTRLTHSRA
jgi:hypothetical protein